MSDFRRMVQRFVDASSRRSVAERWGVSRQTLSHWLGHTKTLPAPEHLQQIAEREGVTVDDVMAGTLSPDGAHRRHIAAKELPRAIALDADRTGSAHDVRAKERALRALLVRGGDEAKWTGLNGLTTTSSIFLGAWPNWAYQERVEDGSVYRSSIVGDAVGASGRGGASLGARELAEKASIVRAILDALEHPGEAA